MNVSKRCCVKLLGSTDSFIVIAFDSAVKCFYFALVRSEIKYGCLILFLIYNFYIVLVESVQKKIVEFRYVLQSELILSP